MLHVDLARQFHYKVNRDMGLICPSWLIFHHCIECHCSPWCFKHWCWPEESSLVGIRWLYQATSICKIMPSETGEALPEAIPRLVNTVLPYLGVHLLQEHLWSNANNNNDFPTQICCLPAKLCQLVWIKSLSRYALHFFTNKCSCSSIFIFTQPKILPVGAKHPHGWQQVLIHF